jgi:4-alpha-glucanotransferase
VSEARPALRALARRLGIADAYFEIGGTERLTSDATRVALLAGMGFAASNETDATRAIAALDASREAALLEPVLVWREFEGRAPLVPLALVPPLRALDWEIEAHLEDGRVLRGEGRFDAGAEAFACPLPEPPPPGHHDLVVRVAGGGLAREGRQRLVMAPRTALRVEERIGSDRVFGIWTNLYTVRSRRNQGFGDATDLAALARWCGAIGGAFVGVNPLHAIPNRGTAITPYSPSSRLFRNVLYLDPEAVPEWRACPAARARAAELEPLFARLRAAAAIDHAAVLDAKRAVLRPLFDCFVANRRARPRAARARAFAAYVAREGAPLRDFATWEVLAEHFGASGAPVTEWRRWPDAYRRPDAPAVEAFRAAHADVIEFQAWLQFELAEQLARAAAAGRDAGLAIGIYQDLAVGSSDDSADTWMAPALFAEGVSVGAPPDAYAPEGQDWGFPPLDPHRSRADGHRFFAALLRAGFASAGALRIDHAMGLARLFWIPRDRSGSEGTYVAYPAAELLGVLALESRRAGALVIAEDLGTVPEGFRPLLAEWGLLSSSVLHFERDGAVPRRSDAISDHALATVDTHDMPPLAGYFAGADLRIRRAVGEIADDAALAAALGERTRERIAWVQRLREEELLAPETEPDAAALGIALHAFLARTPAPLVGVSLDDLAGESEPVNVPGLPVERHRSWTRRMRVAIETLAETEAARAVLQSLAVRARPPSRSDRSG